MMTRRIYRRLLIISLFCVLVSAGAVQGQEGRTVFWERWDTAITNVDTRANIFTVREEQRVRFTGTFTFGTRDYERTTLDTIDDIRVSVNGRALRAACTEQAGTFCWQRTTDYYQLTYYFPRPVANETIAVQMDYRVIGALRSYPDGDQLWWDILPEDRFGFSVGAASITVELPSGFAPREGVDPVETYGAPAEVSVNGTTVRAVATAAIPSGQEFSLRIQYPHDPALAPPRWQTGWDQQRSFDETTAPLLTIVSGAVSVLLGVGGVLFAFVMSRTRGRDPEVGPVPDYLTEPPAPVSPALVGALVDETADMRDIMGMLLDLARRGYFVIEETRSEGAFGIGTNSAFTFKRTDQPLEGLRSYEMRLIQNMFPQGKMERTLESMRNVFHTAISRIQADLYDEMVRQEYFAKNPNTVRNEWIGLGLLLMAAPIGLLIFLSDGLSGNSFFPYLVGPLVGLIVAGGAVTLFGQSMPAKTRLGAEQAAKWRAFEKYLRNLEEYTDVSVAADQFDAYLPYAVAFGLNREWVNRFKNVPSVGIPPWYYPTYMGGPFSRGYHAGSPRWSGGGVGDFTRGEVAQAGGGGFSLDTMSGGLSSGLEAMSSGLNNMLNSASQVMTSKPQSQSSGRWSSGGRGFSGGGFGGGGGSGGGRAGFG